MEWVDLNSPQLMQTSARLDYIPPTDITCSNSCYQVYYASGLTDSSAPISIEIPGSVTHYVDLNKSFFYVVFKIVKKDGSAITAADTVAPNTDLASCLFSGIDVSLNETVVSKSATLYPYKAYIHKLLGTSKAQKETVLRNEFW